jgi:hypothetical protein
MDLAIWADENGDSFCIGDIDCKVGDPVIIVKLNNENILHWIKALIAMLDDGEIINVPGEMGQCTSVD